MNIEHISVSRFQTYQQCPQSYKYRYHLKLPSTEPTQFYFTYGKIVHKIAEEYVRAAGNLSLQEVVDQVFGGEIKLENDKDGNPVFAPRSLPPDYKSRFPEHMRSLQHLTNQIGFEGELEYAFRYDLDPPNQKLVVGFIDRLIKRDDSYFILDYKTSKKTRWRKTNSNITHDLQLRVYAKVIQRDFNVPAEKIKAALYYVEGGDIVAANFSQQNLDEAEKIMLAAHNEISAADPDKVQGWVGDHCRRCEWKKICPYYSLTGSGIQ